MSRTGRVAALVVALLAACGGGVTQHDVADGGTLALDSGAGIVDAGAGGGCAPLAACCQTLAGPARALCLEVLQSGNAEDCATELGQLHAEGDCLAVTGEDSGGPNPSDSSLPMVPDGFGGDSGPPIPASCTGFPCTAPLVCNVLPGASAPACVPPCQTDSDCPAWTTCQSGLCAQCSTCPAGQVCQWAVMPGPGQCTSNTSCSLGQYCQTGGISMCNPIQVCTECFGGCSSCTSNNQCMAGQVCVNQACVTCTSNSQCGPTAVCSATHTGMQCTCTVDGDCTPPETCGSGVCQPSNPNMGCNFPLGCPTGQACVNNTCGACSTFLDCNQQAFGNPRPPQGLACIGGVCTACTANSQCGGGMACVAGTCGTCSTNAQCGASGQCSDGYCMCTGDSQCGSGQRCGGGVCVAM